jgi:hypothetical protein
MEVAQLYCGRNRAGNSIDLINVKTNETEFTIQDAYHAGRIKIDGDDNMLVLTAPFKYAARSEQIPQKLVILNKLYQPILEKELKSHDGNKFYGFLIVDKGDKSEILVYDDRGKGDVFNEDMEFLRAFNLENAHIMPPDVIDPAKLMCLDDNLRILTISYEDTEEWEVYSVYDLEGKLLNVHREKDAKFPPKEIVFPKDLYDKIHMNFYTPNLLDVPSNIKVKILGTGNMDSEYNTSFVIDANKKYLVDTPPYLEEMLGKSKESIQNINDIIITHTHPDHINGLTWFLKQKVDAKQKVNLYTTSEIYQQVLKFLQQQSPWIKRKAESEVLNFKELNNNKLYEEDGIKIAIRDNIHEENVPTIGFKFSRGGKTLGYSGDCKYFGEAKLEQLCSEVIDSYVAVTSINLDSQLNQLQVEILQEKNRHLKKGEQRVAIGDTEVIITKDSLTIAPHVTVSEAQDILKKLRNKDVKRVQSYSGLILNEPPAAFLPMVKDPRIIIDPSRFSQEQYTKFKRGMKRLSAKDCMAKLDLYSKSSFGWFYDCDFIVHEADDSENEVHTNIKELDALPKNLQLKLAVIHFSQDFEAQYKGAISVLRDGIVQRI